MADQTSQINQTSQTEQSVSATGIARLADLVDTQTRHRSGAPMGHPEFDRLVRTIWRLRQSDGCPWDKAQTHDSITKNMVEEAYEAVEAIKEGSSEHLQEELGDVLEQVLLHSQIESDDGGFDIDDVCRALNEKLVRRHPHVFGPEAGNAYDADAALDAWDSVKAAERANEEDRVHTEGLLDSVPYSLPALMQAQKLSKRVAKVGFDWDSVHDIWQKVAEERAEYEVEVPGSEARAEEFGDLLFVMVQLARWDGIDAEKALASANRKMRRRWSRMEELAGQKGFSLEDHPEVLEDLWQQAKSEENVKE